MTQEEIDAIVAAYVTPFDAMQENKARALTQYENGLEISRTYDEITIAINGTWGATRGRHMQGSLEFAYSSLLSNEVLGYHSCTAQLLKGFLVGRENGGAKITDFRIYSEYPAYGVQCLECRHYTAHGKDETVTRCERCKHPMLPFIFKQ